MSGDKDPLLDIPVPEFSGEPMTTSSPAQSSHLNWVRSYSRKAHQVMKEEEAAKDKLRKAHVLADLLHESAAMTGGQRAMETHSDRVNQDEHVLVTCYSNFQILVHIIDNRQMLTSDGSRLQKVWKRERAPHEVKSLVEETKKALANRAAKRANAPKSA